MSDYDGLVSELRKHHCDATDEDTQEFCEECAYDIIIADKTTFSGITGVCVCGLMHRAADAIEKLQRDRNDCRNELCLYCGSYKSRHLGACDGCRWKDL